LSSPPEKILPGKPKGLPGYGARINVNVDSSRTERGDVAVIPGARGVQMLFWTLKEYAESQSSFELIGACQLTEPR
jgi:hypothetical protein